MAYTNKVHGAAGQFSAVGRQAFSLKSFSKTNITQSELDALVTEVAQLNTIMMIGAFEAGVSDVVRMLVEGPGVDNGSLDAGGATFTVADVTF